VVQHRLAYLGGLLAFGVSWLMLGVVLTRDGALNLLDGWTIVVGGAAGLWATRGGRRWRIGVSLALLVLGALPAMIGGLDRQYLYLPSVALLTVAFATYPRPERREVVPHGRRGSPAPQPPLPT
jgi:hypothetical protein